jgi:hypothetical protein
MAAIEISSKVIFWTISFEDNEGYWIQYGSLLTVQAKANDWANYYQEPLDIYDENETWVDKIYPDEWSE